MFKTEVVKSIKDIDLRAQMVTDMINEQTKIGWDYHSGIATHKYSVMLIFKRNAQHKMNEDFQKNVNKVKGKINKVVDIIKSND